MRGKIKITLKLYILNVKYNYVQTQCGYTKEGCLNLKFTSGAPFIKVCVEQVLNACGGTDSTNKIFGIYQTHVYSHNEQ